MIYLDNGATSFFKPPAVVRAVVRAMQTCANPGRGGYKASMDAAREDTLCGVNFSRSSLQNRGFRVNC